MSVHYPFCCTEQNTEGFAREEMVQWSALPCSSLPLSREPGNAATSNSCAGSCAALDGRETSLLLEQPAPSQSSRSDHGTVLNQQPTNPALATGKGKARWGGLLEVTEQNRSQCSPREGWEWHTSFSFTFPLQHEATQGLLLAAARAGCS